MIKFDSDYLEGAHPNILKRMVDTNMDQSDGYGFDEVCESAKNRIKRACNTDELGIYFVAGGTLTNLIVISASLKTYEGCLCAETGHINVHETGAIEATGHKVMTLPTDDGKITAEQIVKACEDYIHDPTITHIVKPGMVYISQPTETGTMYSREELYAISKACRKYDIPLFVDGARLGYALASKGNDVSLNDLVNMTDVFYIGGTKCGAYLGEAVVFSNSKLEDGFVFNLKQKGGMMAKGRLLGIQFDELFKDNLYIKICAEPVKYAIQIREAIESKGYKMRYDSLSNQQFAILPNEVLDELKKNFSYSYVEPYDENSSVVRFCTSWATKKENVDELVQAIKEI